MADFASTYTRARTLLLQRRYDEAERAYAEAVRLEPASLDGQYMLAKLRYMRGDDRFARDLAAVAARNPGHVGLRTLFANVLRLTGDLTGAELLLRDLLHRLGPDPQMRSTLASVLHEQGRLDEAETEASAAAAGLAGDSSVIEVLVGILLSRGRAAAAMPLIREMRLRAPREHIWIAHEATAARLTGDAAYTRLYDYERFVRVYDLDPPNGWSTIDAFHRDLAARLATKHDLALQPFDQSLRSGTQTMGSLVDDDDAAVRAALAAFMQAIAEYRAAIGIDDTHPLLEANRGAARISTCWSVSLRAGGYHLNHIHPEGWLSSAYYVAVPDETSDESSKTGWIKFGEPRNPVPGAGPDLQIRPRAGMLVLFPSYMWHGTVPIRGTGTRLTMPFDVVTEG